MMSVEDMVTRTAGGQGCDSNGDYLRCRIFTETSTTTPEFQKPMYFERYDGIQAISDGKIGWSKFLVKNHPGPLREHILIGLDPKNCLKFSKKVNFMIFKKLVKSTKAKMAISEILPFSGKIVIAAKRKGLKRSPICQN